MFGDGVNMHDCAYYHPCIYRTETSRVDVSFSKDLTGHNVNILYGLFTSTTV